MLLTFDVGNTNITLGLYDGSQLTQSWRLETVHTRTADEYGLLVTQLLIQANLTPQVVTGAIIASVVPVLTRTIESTVRSVFTTPPMIVGPGLKTGMPILYDRPKDVGADRIVNGVAAYHRFSCACIVVDFGTATTFDSITEKGEYAGGAIAPGIGLSMDALFQRTAKLPRVDIARPEPGRVVGRSTVESIQSGVYFGYVGLVDGLVDRMRKEMDPENEGRAVKVLGTGGLAPIIAKDAQTIEVISEALTLEGLRLIYDLNCH